MSNIDGLYLTNDYIVTHNTLTRKSTAMDLCTDLLEEVDDDVIMATDGSIEGMLTALSTRANKPSIFLRDEFSGLIDQMNKKDYMSGLPEFLTKLYDGKMQKRVLRKEVVEVKNPRLIIFGGGIRDAVTSTLAYENIASGFVPRFIFITAESDITKVKPVGPPTEINLEDRNKVLIELMKLSQFYNTDEELHIPETDTVITRKKFFDCTMTPAAWLRYNKLETELTAYGLEHSRKEIMTPVGDRLAKSILKAAILIAATRSFRAEIEVQEIDILRAISYGEVWFTHTRAVVDKIGLGASERKLEKMIKIIADEGVKGTHRSVLMRLFKLTSREYTMSIETLEQRGYVTRTRHGRGEIINIVPDVDLRNV